MNKWKIGENQTLVKNNKFNLSAKRVEPKVISKQFNYKIYKFKIDLTVKRYNDKKLQLNDANIDLLKDGLEHIGSKHQQFQQCRKY